MNARKVSITLPGDLLDEARAYMTDGLQRRVFSDRLNRYLREIDGECGSLTNEEIEAARREWHGED
jgi:hypothetical protein